MDVYIDWRSQLGTYSPFLPPPAAVLYFSLISEDDDLLASRDRVSLFLALFPAVALATNSKRSIWVH